ncbi:MAG: 3-deoxy-D-manno-octulosonic acid transferase [Gammaproteobacteria bacterium]|nr:3-deoxy-D-manno-octulosonic acid transferase [Gammaproteobacteria bacterium]
MRSPSRTDWARFIHDGRGLNDMLRYDLFYLMAALLASPVVAARRLATGKRRTDWRGRFGHVGVLDVPSLPTDRAPPGPADSVDRSAGHAVGEVSGAPARRRPTVLIHGVSVGEVAAIGQLVGLLAARTRVVVSSTTDTGFARAHALYGSRHSVVRYPLDLSWMVRRFLDAVRPDVVALAELEVWPNFVTECTRRGIPVCVVNGRLSPSSYRGYRRARAWIRPVFRQLAAVAAQNETYADRFIDLGVPRDRVWVTDTMKWDTSGRPPPGGRPTDSAANAPSATAPPAAQALAAALALDRTRPLIVAGSTGPGEEKELIATRPPAAQLLLVPRRPERFDAVAALHPSIRRRSRARSAPTDLFLLDTMGELELAYALADVAIVGRSFAPMGGSDPIPAVAAGCATIIGPHHENFADVVSALAAGGGITVTDSPMAAAARLLDDPDARRRMARNGRRVIEEHRGASARTVDLVSGLLRA